MQSSRGVTGRLRAGAALVAALGIAAADIAVTAAAEPVSQAAIEQALQRKPILGGIVNRLPTLGSAPAVPFGTNPAATPASLPSSDPEPSSMAADPAPAPPPTEERPNAPAVTAPAVTAPDTGPQVVTAAPTPPPATAPDPQTIASPQPEAPQAPTPQLASPQLASAPALSPSPTPPEEATGHPAAAPMPAPSAPAPAPVREARLTPPPSIALNGITFELGSARLRPESIATLQNLGNALNQGLRNEGPFQIEGHTDISGHPAGNQQLSLLRAEAVRQFLVRRMHVAPERLRALGKGSAEPANSSNPYAPENRRVVIVNVSAS